MIDWSKVKQRPSDQKCAECGEVMSEGEEAVDSNGHRYGCYVCHRDKRVIWLRMR